MSDPLSITASVVGILMFGLKASKEIRNTVSGISDAPNVFLRTERSLSSLNEKLAEIKSLQTKWKSVDRGGATINPFSSLDGALQRCAEELQPFEVKVKAWGNDNTAQGNGKKFLQRLRHYFNEKELNEIQEIVWKQMDLIDLHLTTLNTDLGVDINLCAQKTLVEVTKSAEILEAVSTTVGESNASQTRHTEWLTTEIEQIKSSQNAYGAQFRDEVAQVKQLIENLGGQLTSFSIDQKHKIVDKLTDAVGASSQQEFSDDIEVCLDTLYHLKREMTNSTSIGEEDSRALLDTLMGILQHLLDPSSFKKRLTVSSQAGDRSINPIVNKESSQQQMRQMQGIIYSSNVVRVENPVPRPTGSGVASRENFYILKETPTTSLALSTTMITFNNNTKISKKKAKSRKVLKTFSACMTILPRSRLERTKLCVKFIQHIMSYGVCTLSPTISFHNIRPLGSEIFEIASRDDLVGLKRMLREGKASLTDCDPEGRSLLQYSCFIRFGEDEDESLEVAKYLIEKGADIDSFEPNFPLPGEQTGHLPLLLMRATSMRGARSLYRGLSKVQRLLLRCGADSSLGQEHGEDYNGEQDTTSLMFDVIRKRHLKDFELVLSQGIFVDIEQRNGITAKTPLLVALDMKLLPFHHLMPLFEASQEQVRLLLKSGASPAAHDLHGENCLHSLFRCLSTNYFSRPPYFKYFGAMRPYHALKQWISLMIRHGAPVTAKNIDSLTPTHVAILSGCEIIWKDALQESGFSISNIYRDSNIKDTPPEPLSIYDEIVDILCGFYTTQQSWYYDWDFLKAASLWEYRGSWKIYLLWSRKLVVSLLSEAIKKCDDLSERLPKFSGMTLSAIASQHRVDLEWYLALCKAGYEPKAVYLESGVQYIEMKRLQKSYLDLDFGIFLQKVVCARCETDMQALVRTFKANSIAMDYPPPCQIPPTEVSLDGAGVVNNAAWCRGVPRKGKGHSPETEIAVDWWLQQMWEIYKEYPDSVNDHMEEIEETTSSDKTDSEGTPYQIEEVEEDDGEEFDDKDEDDKSESNHDDLYEDSDDDDPAPHVAISYPVGLDAITTEHDALLSNPWGD